MSDKPPIVDFNVPFNPIQLLASERRRLQGVSTDIRAAMADVGRYSAEGARYAEIAAIWGATLLVADICKLGLSAGDRRARVLFNAQDRLLGNANKVLKLLGRRTITTKEEILGSIDPDLRGVNEMTGAVQKVRDFLKNVGLRENRETKLLLDLAVAMTQDTLLIMQTMKTQQQIAGNAAMAQLKMRESLSRVNQRILIIDSELTRMIERLQRVGTIA